MVKESREMARVKRKDLPAENVETEKMRPDE